MDELLAFLVQCVIWYFVFKVVFTVIDIWQSKKLLDDEIELHKDKLAKLIHYVNQEKHGEVYYWFDKETDQFLAQGATDDELKAHLLERFKNHIFVLDDKRAMYGPEMKIVELTQLPKLFNEQSKAS